MLFCLEGLGELRERCFQDFEPSGVVRRQRRVAADQVQGGTAFRAGFGQDQGPGREVERGQAELLRDVGARFLPAQPSGDHEVNDDMEMFLQAEHDAFAKPSK